MARKSKSPPSPVKETGAAERPKGDRIAKIMARAGLCSRREAERWVEQGRVSVNGETLTSPAINVADLSSIRVDGAALPGNDPPRLWRYHKPVDVMTTSHDPEGRPTIYDRLPKNLPRVMPVGRLDINSEGLLLMTNDGQLKRHLELPSTGWRRRYRARVYGRVDPAQLAGLSRGVVVEGVRYAAIEAVLDSQEGANAWVTLTLREGKNREVRRVLTHLGYSVNRLIRTAYGPFQLGNLGRDEVEEVNRRALRDQLDAETLTALGMREELGLANRRR
ncbi:MAG: rRNA pseudouridine synthase [Rhodospirillaceae bacterium]|nr:rRNA pseudouridine synthase [Rhodospirillaceae bacterium]MBT5664964.1 rRNA pseudouridine synthase [Rhodospirillaceae bacterium]